MRIRDRGDIVDVLAQCELHWLVGRIPEGRASEMREELHQHLREATRDGKPVESVVGHDVLAFAESWARVDRPSWPVFRRVAWFGHMVVTMVVVFAALAHLLSWDLAVQVRWSGAVLLLVTVWTCVVLAAHIRGVGRPWQASWLMILAASLLTIGAAWGLSELTTGERDGVILVWPWYGTVSLAVFAFVLGWLGQAAPQGSA